MGQRSNLFIGPFYPTRYRFWAAWGVSPTGNPRVHITSEVETQPYAIAILIESL